MASISSLGIGTGVLTSDLVDSLVEASRAPVEIRLDAEQELVEARISDFGTVTNLVSNLSTAASAISSNLTFVSKSANSTDTAAISATASSLARESSFTVNVSELSAAHAIASQDYSESTSTVGEGTITFTFGTVDSDDNFDGTAANSANWDFTADTTRTSKDVTIDSSNSTLTGIRDAVNAADIGIIATVVNTGSNYKLVFQSEDTGKENGFTIQTTPGTGDLDDLDYYDTTTVSNGLMVQSVAGDDASATINGVAVTSDTNVFNEVVTGVTITAKDNTGVTETISVENDSDSVVTKVTSFIDAYNELKTTTNALTDYDVDANEGGIFLGDSTMRTLTTSLAEEIGSLIEGLDGTIRALSDVGVSSSKSTGLLTLDTTELSEALAENPEDLSAVFSKGGVTTDSYITFVNNTTATVAGEYDITVDRLATQGTFYGGDVAATIDIDADNSDFQVKIDGVLSGTISLTTGTTLAAADIAADIQSQINADSEMEDNGRTVTVAYANDRFEITSATYGTNSTVEFVTAGTNALAELGFREPDEGAHRGQWLDTLDDDYFTDTNVTIDSSNNTFELTVNGTASDSINLTAATYTDGDSLATDIQTQINADANLSGAGLTAAVTFEDDSDQGRFVITFGDTIAWQFTSTDTAFETELGFTQDPDEYNIAAGRNVAGTVNGVEGTGFGQKLTAADDDDSEGLSMTITGGSTGDRGTITFIRGVGLSIDDLLDQYLDSDNGLLDIKSDGLAEDLAEIAAERAELEEDLDVLRASLEASFLYNDLLAQQLNSTRDYLEGQFDILNKLISGSK